MARLSTTDGFTLPAESHYYIDETRLYATFDLASIDPGVVDVVLENADGLVATVTGGLEIVAFAESDNRAAISNAPSAVKRPNHDPAFPFQFFVRWGNMGINDVPAPLVVVDSTAPIGLTQDIPTTVIDTDIFSFSWEGVLHEFPISYLAGNSLAFLGVSRLGPAGILMPGTLRDVPVFGLVDAASEDIEIKVDRLGKDPDEPFDWLEIRDGILPDDISDESFEPIFAQLILQVGSTWGDYLAMLSTAATLMPEEIGGCCDPGILIDLALQEAEAALGASISGTVLARDFAVDISGRSVTATNPITDEIFVTLSLNDGSFVFPSVPAGTYDLQFDGAIVAGGSPVTVAADTPLNDVLLTLQPGGLIAGQVLASDTGEPLSHARVTAIASVEGGEVFSTNTDDDGHYLLEGLPAGEYVLQATASERARTIISGVQSNIDLVMQDLELAPQAVFRGSVKLEPGGPEEGSLTVYAVATDGSSAADPFSARISGLSFAIGGLPAGTYDVSLERQGYLRQTIFHTAIDAGDQVDLGEIELMVAARVSGTVVSTSPRNPATGLTVALFENDLPLTSAQVDPTGAFSFPAIDAGDYTARVIDAFDSYSTEVDLIVAAGEEITGVELAVLPGATIAGTVQDSVTNAPLPGVVVILADPSGSFRAAETDVNGEYRFEGADYGDHAVTLLATTTTPTIVSVTAINGELFTAPVVATTFAAGLEGQVLDTHGDAVKEAVVTLFHGGQPVIATTSDSDGRYRFGLFREGVFALEAIGVDLSFPRVTGLTVNAGETVHQDLVAGNASLQVTVTGPPDVIEGTQLYLEMETPGGNQIVSVVTLDASGATTFQGLAEGDYRLNARGSNNYGKSAQVSIAAGQAQSQNVALEQRFTVRGNIGDATSPQLDTARALLVSRDNPQESRCTFSREDGTYEFAQVDPGDYDLVVVKDGYGAVVQAGMTVSDSMIIDVSLSSSTTELTGQVTDAAGNPVRLGLVSVFDSEGRLVGHGELAWDGAFTITTAAGSGLSLRVSAPGYADEQFVLPDVPEGDETALGPLVMQALAISVAPSATPVVGNASPSLPQNASSSQGFVGTSSGNVASVGGMTPQAAAPTSGVFVPEGEPRNTGGLLSSIDAILADTVQLDNELTADRVSYTRGSSSETIRRPIRDGRYPWILQYLDRPT
jgi:hypothetical protein